MILHLFRRSPRDDRIARLYGMIVAQAREPAFYRLYGVPDTVTGRFEMVLIHLILVLDQLKEKPDPVRNLGQQLFDHFCRDMDDSIREMGVGDLAVPRQMRRVGEAFYGRKAVYAAALAAADDGPLADALRRIVFVDSSSDGADCLAAYVRMATRQLAVQSTDECHADAFGFPDPEPFAPRQVASAGAPQGQ